MDGQGEHGQHLAAGGARRGGPHEHAAVGVLDQLDEPLVARLVDPPPGRARARGRCPPRTARPCSRAAASVSPTEPISGSVKVTRGSGPVVGRRPGRARGCRSTQMSAWYIDTWVKAPDAGDVARRPTRRR